MTVAVIDTLSQRHYTSVIEGAIRKKESPWQPGNTKRW